MLQTMSDFTKLWALGYQRLIPIIPPDAPISEGSALAPRIGTSQDARGKTPGVKGRAGAWFGFDWVPYEADEADLTRWHAMGAGTGIKTGHGVYAIDADTLDEASARTIRDTAQTFFGDLPIRVGRYPKALYLIRVAPDMPYARVEFGPLNSEGRPIERVEILGERKQFVAHGIHPGTRQPYTWPRALIPADELTVTTPERMQEFLEALRSALPNARALVTEGGSGAEVNQESLRGEERAVRAAVNATPNTSATFPSREAYRDFGYAIKAALPDDEPTAFEIFSDWCGRWQDGENEPGVVEADWRRMKPPFRRGASWLYDVAERASGGRFTTAEVHFEPIPETQPSIFDQAATKEREDDKAGDVYPLLTIAELANRPPPTFLIDRHIPDVSFGLLYSDPGIGKSFVALDMGLSIAHGLPDWLGDQITVRPEKSTVIYIAAEGSFDLFHRIAAWHKARGIQDFSQNFFVIEQTIDFMKKDDVGRLLRTVASASVDPAIVFVDTVSRAMPGADENGQQDMTLFVEACGAVREAFKCAVVGIHHAGKSGDLRGSTVLRGAADFIMRLDRNGASEIRTMTMEKLKAAPDGWASQIAFGVIDLGDGHSSLSIARADAGPAEGPGRGDGPGAGPIKLRILRAMEAAWEAGEPWASAPQSKRYAVRIMAAEFGLKATAAAQMLAAWGGVLIAEEVRDSRTKRRGYRVLEGALGRLAGGEVETHFSPEPGDTGAAQSYDGNAFG
jgi:hypothetical protein